MAINVLNLCNYWRRIFVYFFDVCDFRDQSYAVISSLCLNQRVMANKAQVCARSKQSVLAVLEFANIWENADIRGNVARRYVRGCACPRVQSSVEDRVSVKSREGAQRESEPRANFSDVYNRVEILFLHWPRKSQV